MPQKKTRRADGRYTATVFLGRKENGSQIRKFFYGKTQKEANKKRDAFLNEKQLAKDANTMTIKKWSEKWLESYTGGGFRNQANNASIINQFLEHIGGNKALLDIRPADIQGYSKILESYSKSHVDKVRRNLTNMFKAAVENDYIAKSPCEGIVWNYVKNGTREPLEQWQIDLISNHWTEHKAGTWAMLSLYAGLRPSECFALDRSNVSDDYITVTDGSHFEHGKLVIVKGAVKSEAGQRSIPIPKPLKPVIASLPKEGLVCRSASDEPVSESAYKRNWAAFWNILEQYHNNPNAVIKKAGRRTDKLPEDYVRIEKPEMYTLRHTYCSMLYDADVDVKTAQYLMGHATLDMTLKIYTHLSEKKKKRSFDRWLKHFEYDTQE